MTDDLTPGAPVFYPSRVAGTDIAHLARVEARADGPPALHAVCPAGSRIVGDLELVPEDDADRLAWCGACKTYLEYLENNARTRESIRRAVSNGHPA